MVKEHQIRKFQQLQAVSDDLILLPEWMKNDRRTQILTKASGFINWSSRPLSSTETYVLKRGLNFAPTPKEIPVVDIVIETECDKNYCIADRRTFCG